MVITSEDTTPVRFLLISDTHSFAEPPSNDAEQPPLPKHLLHQLPTTGISVLIHSGDLTMTGTDSENASTYDLISSHPAELKIVIPGNHDVTLDEPYYNTVGASRFHRSRPQDTNSIRNLWTGPFARARGIAYVEEGLQTFRLRNGAEFTVYASAWTPEFQNWAFAYGRDQDRFNPPPPPSFASSFLHRSSKNTIAAAPSNPVPEFPVVDIMITHGPPLGILDKVPPRLAAANHGSSTSTDPEGLSVGCEHLWNAVRRARPRLHVFGHIHEGWGAGTVRWEDGTASDPLQKSLRKFDGGEGVQDEMERVRQKEAVTIDARSLEQGKETLFVNASMVDVRYRGVNRAWVVEMDLLKTNVKRDDDGDVDMLQ